MAGNVIDDDDDDIHPIPSTGGFRVGRHYLFYHDAEYVCTRISPAGAALFEACTDTDHPDSFERPRFADAGVMRLVQYGENPEGDVTTDEETEPAPVGGALHRQLGALQRAFTGGSASTTLGDVAGPVSKPLSGDEVTKLSGGARVVRYPDLAQYPTWQALMGGGAGYGGRGKVAVLFLVSSPTDGHWIGLFDGPDGPHVFDPLGVAVDAERNYISAGMQAQLGETQPQVHRLLQTTAGPAHVSKAHFQRDAPDVNTCGRWTGLRLRQSDMTDDAFQAFVTAGKASSGLASSDAWVDAETGGPGR